MTDDELLDPGTEARPATHAGDADACAPALGADLVAGVVHQVCGQVVGVTDDLLARGLSSLDLARIAGRLRLVTGRTIGLRDVYELRTPAAIAAAAPGRRPADHPDRPLARADRANHSQERMWFLHAIDPTSSAYHVVDAVRLSGRVDADRLERAWRAVVERHTALRTSFPATVDGPRRVVHDAPLVELRRCVLPAGAADECTALLEELAAEPFDLAAGPVFRVALVTVGDDQLVMGVSAHHIVADQWALAVLYDEVSAAYRGDAAHTSPHADVDLAVPSAAVVERDLAYWRGQLAGAEPTALPVARRVPDAREPIAGMVVRDLDAVRRAVDERSAAWQVAPSAIYLAAFAATLQRYGCGSEVVVGMPVANRTEPELDRLVTTTVNTVVLRLAVADGDTALTLVERAHGVMLDALDHSATPYSLVVADHHRGAASAAPPLFHVMLNVLNVPFEPVSVEGATSEPIPVDRRGAQFELSLTVDLAATSRLLLDHLRAAVPDAVAERFADHFLTVLDALVHHPQLPVDAVDLATDAERAERAARVAAVRRPIPAATVHRAVEAQADRTPGAVAVRGVDGVLTYAELDARANELARRLLAAGVRPRDLVGVHLDRTTAMVVAVLGVLKAGAAYVPLDPAFPRERLAFMVADAGIRVVVATEATVDLGVPVTVVAPPSAGHAARPIADVGPHDLAYVIYTSGSTGRPKGVELEHRSVVNFLESMRRRPGLGDTDVVLAITTLSFDISVLEVFLPLVVGASVVVATKDDTLSPSALADLIDAHGVTCLQATPATFGMLLDHGWRGAPGLVALCGGEAVPADLVAGLLDRCRAVWNVYGPTETTVWSAALQMSHGAPVRVGGPLDNTVLSVLDDRGRPVPRGVPGELVIGGDGLARGYHGRPDLTGERFVPDPDATVPGARRYRTGDVVREEEDGSFEFLGRSDHQVKVRGFRIELGEIEAVLATVPGVAQAAVVARPASAGDVRLLAFLVAEPEGLPGIDELRAALAGRLPAYMVPSVFVTLDELPLTPNRKVDRAALPAVDPGTGSAEPASAELPRHGLERVIADIWADVLDIDHVGRHDDFFALGGHSLLAVQVFTRLERLTGIDLPLTTLFASSTVAGLAERAASARPPTAFTSLVTVRADGDRPPWFYVAPFLVTALSFEALGRHLGPDQPCYVLQPQGMEDDAAIHDRVEDMAAHYVEEMRAVQPIGPYHLGGHCAGGWVAFEMARQLAAAGEQVATLVLVDVEPPGIPAPRGARARGLADRAVYYLRSGRTLHAVQWKLGVLRERAVTRRVGSTTQRRVAELRERHLRAHEAYRGGTYPGGAVLVRSEEHAAIRSMRWHLRWVELLDGPLDVEIVPGAHSALVSEASSEALAAIIRRSMDVAMPG